MKKRLIALMISGLLMTGTLVGCAEIETEEKMIPRAIKIDSTIEDVNICVERKDGYVLHKGDINYFKQGEGRVATGINLTEMHFDCGKTLTSNATYTISKDMPEEADYDYVCEDCFSQGQ